MGAIILAKATGPGETADFVVSKGWPQTITIYPAANVGSDVGLLKIKNPDGTYDPVYDDSGIAIQFTATALNRIVDGLGTYHVIFATRASAIGVTKQKL